MGGGGLTSSNLSIRLGMKYFFLRWGWTKEGRLFRKGGFFALTQTIIFCWYHWEEQVLKISTQLPFLFRFYSLLNISGYTSQFWEAIIRNSQIYKALEDSPLNVCLGSSLETV